MRSGHIHIRLWLGKRWAVASASGTSARTRPWTRAVWMIRATLYAGGEPGGVEKHLIRQRAAQCPMVLLRITIDAARRYGSTRHGGALGSAVYH